jgi:hypothetical protein
MNLLKLYVEYMPISFFFFFGKFVILKLVRLTLIFSHVGVIRGAHSVYMHHVIKNRRVEQRKHEGV